jgi:Methane oxygenase PmoA
MRSTICLAGLLMLAVAGTAGRAADPAPVSLKVDKGQIDFLAGSDLVASYHAGAEVAKPYLWPLNGPGGVPVTRAWPMVKDAPNTPPGSTDHVHQKSAWFCHGDVIPEGIEIKQKIAGVEGIDFWTEGKGRGKIVCVKIDEPQQDKNHGWITTHNQWQTPEGTAILNETRTIHFYNLGDARLFVFDIDLHAGTCPITFGDTKEGAFGVRVSDEMCVEVTANRQKRPSSGKIENAQGKMGEKEIWGHRAPWCDYSGTVQNRAVGIALFADPANPFPSCWHTRGYGLHSANPFGRAKSGFPDEKGNTDLVKLAKGEHLKLRYGILIHPGNAKEGKVADYFETFTKLKG